MNEKGATPEKTIKFREVAVTNERLEEVVVKQPYVVDEFCIGCGICENKCPVVDQPAIYVTSVGESRSEKNQLLLDLLSVEDPYK